MVAIFGMRTRTEPFALAYTSFIPGRPIADEQLFWLSVYEARASDLANFMIM